MRCVVENFKTGRLELAELPAPAPRDGYVLVANRASLISAGTERAGIEFGRRSLAGKALERPDLVRQVLGKLRRDGLAATVRTVRSKLDTPVALGYSSAGVALEVGKGVEDIRPGDAVACAGAGYATHSEVVSVPKNLCARVPDGVSFAEAAYVTLGAVAMHGVRQAEPALGERAAVVGCGLLGLIAVQLLSAAGLHVFAVDIDRSKAELAETLGAGASAAGGDAELVEKALSFSGGEGLDSVYLTAATKSSEPLHLASRLARERGKIVAVGDVGLEVRRRPFYEKELTLLMSRSYGPGRYDPNYEERGIEYPLGYVRWGERRNLSEFLSLVADGKVDLAPLTTHRFDFDDALSAYDLILGKREEPHIGILLSYPEEPRRERRVELPAAASPVGEGKIGVGFVGAGAFAQSVLLPALSRVKGAEPVAILSAGGLSAGHAGRKWGFRYAATDFEEMLADGSVDACLIATRHNLHASQAAAALSAGKHVFVEKPLALTRDELEEVRCAHAESGRILMVGFNRRFSPHAARARELFSGQPRPLSINYRVNAGTVPSDSWLKDPGEGGGRVIGEVCHFIDLAVFLAGAPPESVYCLRTGGEGALEEDADSVVLLLEMADGSAASIIYTAAGDASFSKERVEVAGAGRTAVIEDFRRTLLYSGGKRETFKTSQRKGHREELEAFFEGLRSGRPPISPEELYAVTAATFAAEESLSRGGRVAVEV